MVFIVINSKIFTQFIRPECRLVLGILFFLRNTQLNRGKSDVVNSTKDVIEVNPSDLNFSQRIINRRFNTPDGQKKVNKVIKEGPKQVESFPPLIVREVEGIKVVIEGNRRLYVARITSAEKVKIILDQSYETGKWLNERTKRQRSPLPRTGTTKFPVL